MCDDQHLARDIINGAVGVVPTDTIFGIVASVSNEKALRRVHAIKGRPVEKRFIVLIGSMDQLSALGIVLNKTQQKTLRTIWPGPVSVDITCDNTLSYLHAGQRSIAVRLPADEQLRKLITQSGPIIATSANISGQPTPSTIHEIKNQLPGLDFYIDGPVGTVPSRLARLSTDGKLEWLER